MYLVTLQRIALLAFAACILVSVPLFKAYGYGTNKNKVRVAPLQYFLHGLEQMDFVKKSKRFRGMTNDLGVWLHVPGEIAEDYGVTQFLETKLGYKSIWKSKHVKTSLSKSKSKSKKKKKKEAQERLKKEQEKQRMTYTQRARYWQEGLKDVKDMAKGDLVGVVSGGFLVLSSLIAPLVPAAAQIVFISLLGMQVGVSRQGLPGNGLLDTFYYMCGLLVVVVLLDQFIPDPFKEKLKAEADAKRKELRKAKRKAAKKAAKEKSNAAQQDDKGVPQKKKKKKAVKIM